MVRLTREEIIIAFTNAGVEFPETTSIAQLRTLYDLEIVNHQEENKADSRDENGANIDEAEIDRADGYDENGANIDETEIDRRLRVARNRRESRELEAEEAAGQNIGARVIKPRCFDFHAFEAMVHHFSGDDLYDVLKWFADIEDVFQTSGGSEREWNSKIFCGQHNLTHI